LMGFALKLKDSVYAPSDDSFMLADELVKRKGTKLLEIGCGCGLLSLIAARNGFEVFATDINPEAAYLTKENARANGLYAKVNVVVCDLAACFKGEFDLIVFNPPYLPERSSGELLDLATCGGEGGIEVLLNAADHVKGLLKRGGSFLFILSSRSNVSAALNALTKEFAVRTLQRKEFFLEELALFEATLKPRGASAS